MNNRLHVLKIVVVALVALGVSLGLWYYLNGYLSKSKASSTIVRFGFVEKEKTYKQGDPATVHADLKVSASPAGAAISGIDITFSTTGSNLSFLFKETAAALIPSGFEMVLDEATSGTPVLKRLVLISKRKGSLLPKSAIIPLFFTVVPSGAAAQTVLTANIATAQVVGVSEANVSGALFTTEAESNGVVNYTISVDDPRAASVTHLDCYTEKNLSPSNCGKAVALIWGDSPNEDTYQVYKNNQLLPETLGKNSTTFSDRTCSNYEKNNYMVIAVNSKGSVSKTSPTVSCACLKCPTGVSPTPTPIPPTNSADLMFRLVFPDALTNINEITDVRITVFDNTGKKVCPDDTNCAKVVTFTRVSGSRVPNTFSSPQLQYSSLTKNQAYTIVVTQNITLKQTYKNVYLKWQKVLQCNEGSTDSACGDLIEEVVTRPLFSGDLDGSNNVDQKDLDKVNAGLGTNSAEGDLNFDKITDERDVAIVGKNFNKKGT